MTEKERQYKRQRERKTAIESGDKHSQTQLDSQAGQQTQRLLAQQRESSLAGDHEALLSNEASLHHAPLGVEL